MNREDDEHLWDLLGQVKTPEISPFFARDVVRRVREEPGWKIALRSWTGVRLWAPAAGIAAVVVAAIMLAHHDGAPARVSSAELDPASEIDPQDYEVVADLDVLLASEENNLWDDNSL